SFANLDAGGSPWIGAGAEFVGVEALPGADAAGAGATVTERDADEVVGMSGLNPYGAFEFPAVQFEFDNIFRGELQTVGHLGTNEDRVVPSELRHRLGKFLQPAVVGELAVVDRGIA